MTSSIDAITALLVVLLGVQIWLLSATLDAYLAGHTETALPGAIISGILFASCFVLYLFVRGVDARASRGRLPGSRPR
ncbi:MAG: hypothetical protein KGN84_13840 [Acidobacteriota bacterium]|nr:hypothetical protein [Acidobacteriota bacterium]